MAYRKAGFRSSSSRRNCNRDSSTEVWLDGHARHSISAITPFAAVHSIIVVDVNVAVALAAAAAAMQRCRQNAPSCTAYLPASCQTKLWLWILWRTVSGQYDHIAGNCLSTAATNCNCMHAPRRHTTNSQRPQRQKLTVSCSDDVVLISVLYIISLRRLRLE